MFILAFVAVWIAKISPTDQCVSFTTCGMISANFIGMLEKHVFNVVVRLVTKSATVPVSPKTQSWVRSSFLFASASVLSCLCSFYSWNWSRRVSRSQRFDHERTHAHTHAPAIGDAIRVIQAALLSKTLRTSGGRRRNLLRLAFQHERFIVGAQKRTEAKMRTVQGRQRTPTYASYHFSSSEQAHEDHREERICQT